MKWFRTNIKHGSRLALMALVVQFVLTSGHVHAADLKPNVGLSAAMGLPIHITTEITAVPAVVSMPQPKSDSGSQPAADVCPICAVMVLAGNVLLATPPVLLLPQAVELLYLATDAEFVHLETARVAFQPRAPPVS